MSDNTIAKTGMTGWGELTVGQLVARHPQTARVFEIHGIDYCCGGKRTLESACAREGADVDAVRAELAEALSGGSADQEVDWDNVSMTSLVDHIESGHHRYIRDERPRLTALAQKVARVHGSRHPELIELASAVERIFEDLEPHLEKEEKVFFPAFRAWEKSPAGGAPDPELVSGLEAVEAEHTAMGEILVSIRKLTSGFEPPQDACNSYLALFHGLEGFEADLHEHIHKENNILHARITDSGPQ